MWTNELIHERYISALNYICTRDSLATRSTHAGNLGTTRSIHAGNLGIWCNLERDPRIHRMLDRSKEKDNLHLSHPIIVP
jgi:hypothetical protein